MIDFFKITKYIKSTDISTLNEIENLIKERKEDFNKNMLPQIEDMIELGQNLKALKTYKDLTNCSLKESKDYIDRIANKIKKQKDTIRSVLDYVNQNNNVEAIRILNDSEHFNFENINDTFNYFEDLINNRTNFKLLLKLEAGSYIYLSTSREKLIKMAIKNNFKSRERLILATLDKYNQVKNSEYNLIKL